METLIEMVYRRVGAFEDQFEAEHPKVGFGSEVYRMALMKFIAELVEEVSNSHGTLTLT